MSKTVKVQVACPDRSREGFDGYWAAQTFFRTGKHVYDVAEEKLKELEAEPLLVVHVLTPDEVKALTAPPAPVEPPKDPPKNDEPPTGNGADGAEGSSATPPVVPPPATKKPTK